MNRNVTIVVVILVLVVIAGYLIWLRSKFQSPVTPQIQEHVQVTPAPQPAVEASPSATPGGPPAGRAGKEATGSMKQKTGTAPAIAK